MRIRPIAVALMLATTAAPALAGPEYRRDHQLSRHDQGSWHWRDHHDKAETVRVEQTDTNSCIEGSVIGGLVGAGLGAALSRGNGRWIGVPLGGAAGVLIGCQVDGG